VLASFVVAASAQFGFGRKSNENAAGTLGDLGDAAGDPMAQRSDVDIAMAGWEQLGNNPEKMQELMASFKDPDVWAKAQEMLKDPQYMAAAKAKVADLQAKAQANGMLDANGQPVPGNMAQGGLDKMMGAMGLGGGAAGHQQARDWELDNIERHKEGAMNTAELGMANMKAAMKDPSVMAEVAQMMKDPENMAQLKKMMSDPSFQAQAKRVAERAPFMLTQHARSQLQRNCAGGALHINANSLQ